MSVVVPEPVPLDQPDERPDALADLVLSVAGAAESLALAGDGLAGTPGAAPHWVGADAQSAAIRLRRVRQLTGECSAAVLSVAGRLSVHADRLATIRTAVAGLRTEQGDDFAATWRRLSHLPGDGAGVITDPEAGALIEELRASEEGRLRRHAALIEELAADAAATARVLGDAAGVVGGRGVPGDGNRVIGRLAPELPGWGSPELAARGRALAGALLDAAPGDLGSLVGDAAPYADQAAFVDGLLLGLGVTGLRELLGRLGETELSAGRVVARLLGSALGSARPTGAGYDPIGELFTGSYVDPVASGLADDRVVLGMGVVLAATRSTDGPPLGMVAAWGRQMLARERAQARGVIGTRARDRDRSADAALPHDDAVALVAERLARAEDHTFAAQLLVDRTSWDVLLSRPWDDGGRVLAGLVHAAALEPGPAGDLAVRAGLQALVAGLSDDGDPRSWTVDRGTARAISPALGGALVAHLTVATDALADGADGWITTPTGGVLRGLGYLTLDQSVAGDLERALAGWSSVQPVALDPDTPAAPLPAIAVPAAFEAVREYGQRLAYALQAYEKKGVAESRAWAWNHTVGLATDMARGPLGTPAGIASGYLAMALGFDGTWANGHDRGLRFDQEDAISAARAALPPERARAVEALARQAALAYAGTAFALGDPMPPRSPESHWWEPLVGALLPGPDDVVTAGRTRAGVLGSAVSAGH